MKVIFKFDKEYDELPHKSYLRHFKKRTEL